MSKFEGTDFDNVEQGINIGVIKGEFDAWKSRWNKGTEWGIVGGKKGEAKPKTVLETVLNNGDATYARDQARSTEGLGALLESLTEIFDGDVIETEHRNQLQEDIDDLLAVLKNKKWNPRNIPFETVVKVIETDGDPIFKRGTVYGHYRTEEYNEYVEWASENKPNFKGQRASTKKEWYAKKQGVAQPPLWQAITGEGDTDFGKNGILAIARRALKGVDKIKMGDGNRVAIFNNSKGPIQLAQIKSVQEKVMEVINDRSIYPDGRQRNPQKDRLNAAFTNESYAIRNEEEANLLDFARGFDRIEGIETLKNIQLRFPRNNKALNKTIREVLKVLGQDINTIETPKSKAGEAREGLVLKQQQVKKYASSLEEMLQKKTRCFNPQRPLAQQLRDNDIPIKMVKNCSQIN